MTGHRWNQFLASLCRGGWPLWDSASWFVKWTWQCTSHRNVVKIKQNNTWNFSFLCSAYGDVPVYTVENPRMSHILHSLEMHTRFRKGRWVGETLPAFSANTRDSFCFCSTHLSLVLGTLTSSFVDEYGFPFKIDYWLCFPRWGLQSSLRLMSGSSTLKLLQVGTPDPTGSSLKPNVLWLFL